MKKLFSPEGEITPLELIYWLLELIFIFNNISKNQIFPKFIFIIYYDIKMKLISWWILNSSGYKMFQTYGVFECSKFRCIYHLLASVRYFVFLVEPSFGFYEGLHITQAVWIDHPRNQPETIYTMLDILDQGETKLLFSTWFFILLVPWL